MKTGNGIFYFKFFFFLRDENTKLLLRREGNTQCPSKVRCRFIQLRFIEIFLFYMFEQNVKITIPTT